MLIRLESISPIPYFPPSPSDNSQGKYCACSLCPHADLLGHNNFFFLIFTSTYCKLDAYKVADLRLFCCELFSVILSTKAPKCKVYSALNYTLINLINNSAPIAVTRVNNLSKKAV